MFLNKHVSSINLSKFKRLFTFGCSFTSYGWPTWADIIYNNIPDVDYHNFGYPGGGNMLIACRLIEANLRYEFTDTDLIMVMWSTTCREDRYKNNKWWRGGNVYTSEIYSREFARQYGDTKGYLIRDLALITHSFAYMQSIPASCIAMSMVGVDYEQDYTDPSIIEIMKLYKNTTDLMLPNMLDSVMGGQWTGTMAFRKRGLLVKDPHPSPNQYFDYLKFLGFPLSEESRVYADTSTKILDGFVDSQQLFSVFPEIKPSKIKNIL